MGAAKISIKRVLTASPDINVLDLAVEAVNDHRHRNGCVFEEDAAIRAVRELGISPAAKAADLTNDTILQLGDRLEAMEIYCSGAS